MSDFITPPSLEPTDKVGIVSPASGLADLYPHVYELGLDRLESVFDLEPVEFPTATKSDTYLSDHPKERAEDIEKVFRDPEIRGVIATIGGNDQIRILKHLNGDVLRDNPTRFYGISDNTNLAHYLWNQGIVSFYGGNLLTEFAVPGSLPEYLEASLRSALFDESIGSIQAAPEFTDEDLDWNNPENLDKHPEMESNPGWVWRGGEDAVEGRTWGGSLEITYLQAAAGRYLPSSEALNGAVLLLETSEELPSSAVVQRMLLGLGERGFLSQFDGFLIGRVKARSRSTDRTKEEREEYREQQRETITDIITDYNSTAPIVLNVDFGHTNPVVPVPLGGMVSIDPQNGNIEFK
jgi:muramoyltetrapeptide carboxypeptidase LdcA involved in peptidoglycan recycling